MVVKLDEFVDEDFENIYGKTHVWFMKSCMVIWYGRNTIRFKHIFKRKILPFLPHAVRNAETNCEEGELD